MTSAQAQREYWRAVRMQEQADAHMRRWRKAHDVDPYDHLATGVAAEVSEHWEAVSASLEMIIQELGEEF